MEESHLVEKECIREDRIITFDVRGTIIKTYASTIQFCDSAFFRGILGTGGMQTLPQSDGSFFVDCNPNVFYSILAYIETGHHTIPIRTKRNNKNRLNNLYRLFLSKINLISFDLSKEMHNF